MSTNGDHPTDGAAHGAELADLLAAYAVDAVEPDDVLLIESYLARSEAAATTEGVLREAGTAYGTAMLPDAPAPAGLRDRVLTAAFERRPGVGLTPASMATIHRIETERVLLLLERLSPEQWQAVVDPPELAGWTVRRLAIHLLANQSLLALELGIDAPRASETERDNLPRTEAFERRLEGRGTAEIIDEYRSFVRAVDEHIAALDDDALEGDMTWWGVGMRVSTGIVVRTFETWTHADDIRRAVGLPSVAPAAPALRTMSQRSLEWAPLMLAFADDAPPSGVATVVLTGPGGGIHTIQLGMADAPPDARPRFELTLDVIDYCRAIANRVGESGLGHRAVGDHELAEKFVQVIPSLSAV